MPKQLGEGSQQAADLLSLLMAYKVADVLEALSDSGILDRLCHRSALLEDVARDAGLLPEFLEPLLMFAVRIGLLELGPEGFGVTVPARPLLPLIKLELWTRRWHAANGSLAKALRDGQRQDPMACEQAGAIRSQYDQALSGFCRSLALNLARESSLRGKAVLDLGGADGALAEQLLALKVASQVVVADRATAQAGCLARRDQAGLDAEALQFCEVDLRDPASVAPLLAQADLVMLSNVAHLLAPDERRRLWQLMATQGKAGGWVVVYDQFPADAGQAQALGSAELMVIDWLKCGVRFDLSAAAMGTELADCGLVLATMKQPVGLPGHLLLLRVPAAVSQSEAAQPAGALPAQESCPAP